jgi:hypothetical protein
MKHFISATAIKPGLFILFLLFSGNLLSQSRKGKILSSETKSGIGYVNIAIAGKNTGTVSDGNGNFILDHLNVDENDSIRFSMIGYKSRLLSADQFSYDSINTVYLDPMIYSIREVKIKYHRLREVTLGSRVITNDLRSGFANNDLGSELGIRLFIKGLVELKDLNLNVAVCSYDSVTFRLNIYQLNDNNEYENTLTVPIYLSFSKDKIKDAITVDLSKYSIIIGGDVYIALELYKDLGEGGLLFHTEFFTGTTYHRKAIGAKWIAAPGVIGMYLHGQKIK